MGLLRAIETYWKVGGDGVSTKCKDTSVFYISEFQNHLVHLVNTLDEPFYLFPLSLTKPHLDFRGQCEEYQNFNAYFNKVSSQYNFSIAVLIQVTDICMVTLRL